MSNDLLKLIDSIGAVEKDIDTETDQEDAKGEMVKGMVDTDFVVVLENGINKLEFPLHEKNGGVAIEKGRLALASFKASPDVAVNYYKIPISNFAYKLKHQVMKVEDGKIIINAILESSGTLFFNY